MLQSQTISHPQEEDHGHLLTPSHILEIAKRRFWYFLIPFLLVAAVGSVLALAWPAKYLSSGKVLVLSPEIPTDLVQPTVVSFANERMEVLQQRVMTRDNLLALATKFHLSTSWRGILSGTEIVDFIRQRTSIQPVEATGRGRQKQAIAYTVGFEYEQPRVAMNVANELLTMILKEDARTRTSHAAETTNFLERDVRRIEAQLALLDSKIAELKLKEKQKEQQEAAPTLGVGSKVSTEREIASLRAQLLFKSATYSDSHPDIIALKRKIKALEKVGSSTVEPKGAKSATPKDAKSATPKGTKSTEPTKTKSAEEALAPELDTLESKRASLRKEFEAGNLKLATARLGESLERGQHSERLEVIEQPVLPQKPVSPNRPKLFAAVLALALMAGGGLALAAEMFDHSVRRSSDLFSLVDSHLVVSIPYITTRAEKTRKKRVIISLVLVLFAIVVAAAVAVIFILPPLDLLFDKLTAKALTILFR